ncbi:SprB repeat-containing protein [Tenacibaculum sp. SG-28]|uniref:SprB repeat-containing protein n=1 Tax=Tenacibaculum sp. SG-28 TaxID=754426 RepID=UPI000CF50260|nr:SprB repeat-containing protein [Tenacibaculum sp. SG-28]PQJ23110.1 hypothetical protein BSU00_02315 [Tenacibaculum sp. SG-28]
MDIKEALPENCVIDTSLTGFDFININPADYAPYQLQYSIDNGASWADFNTISDGQLRGFNSGDIVFPVLRTVESDGITTRCLIAYGQYEIPYPVEGLIVDPVANPTSCTSGFSVTVEAFGGTGPYEFAIGTPTTWLPPDGTDPNTLTFYNLIPGLTYEFFVRDASGCIKKNNEDVYADFTPSVPISATVDKASCNGSSNGEITFSIDNTSGDLVAPFTYTLFKRDATNTGVAVTGYENISQADFADITVTGLNQGEYYILITGSGAGCQFGSTDTLIQEGVAINGSISKVNDITCDVDGAVRVDNVTGGFPGYTYSAKVYETGNNTNAIAFNITNAGLVTVNDTDLGGVTSVDVEISVTDSNGCPQVLGIETLTLLPPPSIASVTSSSCDTNKTITVVASGGTAPYQYSIDGGSTYTNTTSNTTYTFDGLVANSYDVVVKDANGCTDTQNNQIVYPGTNFTLTTGQNLNCVPGEAEINVTLNSGASWYCGRLYLCN